MSRMPYNATREHERLEDYPAIPGLHNPEAPGPYGPEPHYWRPISPKENMKLLLLEGKKPWYIPMTGWFQCDVLMFRPRQHPDNLANLQIYDGGPLFDKASKPNPYPGWFDLPYVYEPKAKGCMVKPGFTALDDMSEWRDVLTMPDLDDMDWDEIYEMNKDYLQTDKVVELGIQFGLWERLMNLMGVTDAAMALLDEDQEEGIVDFLDTLSDVYCDYIRRMKAILPIDMVFFHDDWGTSTGPFFSLDTCMKFFVPPMRKVVSCCHELGIMFEHHCCGKAQDLVPAMIETGSDYWFPQPLLNDLDMLVKTYADAHLTFSLSNPFLGTDMTDDEVRQIAKEWVDEYAPYGVLLASNRDAELALPGYDPSKFPLFRDAVYEFSRIAYQDEE